MDILKNVFGYESFKNTTQRNAVVELLQGSSDLCITMPSGCGRRLCFQLAALMMEGKIVIVFSPDVFLMKKEIMFWKSKGIGACLLHRFMAINQWKKIIKNLLSAAPKWKFIYCTPKLISVHFVWRMVLGLRERNLLAYIVFDQAHRVSEWEYEYPNYYDDFKYCDEVYEGVRRVALAPVVTYKVLKDIINMFSLKNPKICKMFTQHSNVYYDTCNIDGLHQPIDNLCTLLMQTLDCTSGPIPKTDKDSAIIYCRQANEAEELKNKLNERGIPTLAYHNKTDSCSRDGLESKWISGEGCVMITTYDYEFIHNRAIRVAVYWTAPESIRQYYRESGRPRKGNARIHSRIYFSAKDYHAIKLVIEISQSMNSKDHVENQLNEFEELMSYCSSTTCRHVCMFKYFGHIVPPCKTNCDVCIMQNMGRASLNSEFVKYLDIRRLNEDSIDGQKGIVKNNEQVLQNLPLQKNKECSLKTQLLSCKEMHTEISNDKNKKDKSAHCEFDTRTSRYKQGIINNLSLPQHTRKTECREVQNTQSRAMSRTLQKGPRKFGFTRISISAIKNSENYNAQSSVALKSRKIINILSLRHHIRKNKCTDILSTERRAMLKTARNPSQKCALIRRRISDNRNSENKNAQSSVALESRKIINNLSIPQHTRKTECREVENAQHRDMLKTLQNNSPKFGLTQRRVSDNKNSENKNAQSSVALKSQKTINNLSIPQHTRKTECREVENAQHRDMLKTLQNNSPKFGLTQRRVSGNKNSENKNAQSSVALKRKKTINNLSIPQHTRKTECREVENTQHRDLLKTLQNNSPKFGLTQRRVSDNKNSENKNAQSSVALKSQKTPKDDERNILQNIPSKSQSSYSGTNNNYNNEKVDAQTNSKIVIDRKTNSDREASIKTNPLQLQDMRQDTSKGNNNEKRDAQKDSMVLYHNKEKPSTSSTNVTTTKISSIKYCKRNLNVSKVRKDESRATLSNRCVITPKILVNTYNLNEDAISVIPVISIESESETPSQINQRDTHIIQGQVPTQKSKQIISMDDAHLKNFRSNAKKAKSVSSGNYSARSNIVSTNERHKSSNKRQICTNEHEKELNPIKRRKIAFDSELSSKSKLNLNKRTLAEHNTDSETECEWIDCTPSEVLMQKFNLNTSEITLKRKDKQIKR